MIDIEAVKDRITLEDAFQFVGLEFPSTNRKEVKILCPVHEERTPSCSVWPAEQRWWCFGCGAGGDIFNLVQAIKKVDFGSAAKQLAELAGLEGDLRPEPSQANKSPSALFREASDVAHGEIVKLLKRRGVLPDCDGEQELHETCFSEYDEIERMFRVEEISATEALNQILKWRLRWKSRLV